MIARLHEALDVACCNPRQKQPATYDQYDATTLALHMQQGSMITRARATLERNKSCNATATYQKTCVTNLKPERQQGQQVHIPHNEHLDHNNDVTTSNNHYLPMQQHKTAPGAAILDKLHCCLGIEMQHATPCQNSRA